MGKGACRHSSGEEIPGGVFDGRGCSNGTYVPPPYPRTPRRDQSGTSVDEGERRRVLGIFGLPQSVKEQELRYDFYIQLPRGL